MHLGSQIYLVDLHDLGMKERTGSYVMKDEQLTIIETSASPSIPYLLEGLKQLEIDPKDIIHIIVTHIHLDHAGGVGVLLEHCPNATVYVHPKGKRHLEDPTKLIKGAKAVYGPAFDTLFHPILPVPPERLVTKSDGETLQIGKNRKLTFYDTPGHAKHHFSIHDSESNGIFTGDTIGILYPVYLQDGKQLVLPSTSPNHFDDLAMTESMNRIKNRNVNRIYFGHYGMSLHPENVYEQMEYWLPRFVQTGERVYKENRSGNVMELTSIIAERLTADVKTYLINEGISEHDEVFQYLQLDMQVCAMGILDALFKKNKY